MKNLLLALSIIASIATPVSAEDLCSEQAEQLGYVGAIEVLEPCHESAREEVAEAAQAIEPATPSPTSKRIVKKRSDKSSFGLEDVYTQ